MIGWSDLTAKQKMVAKKGWGNGSQKAARRRTAWSREDPRTERRSLPWEGHCRVPGAHGISGEVKGDQKFKSFRANRKFF